MSLQGATQGEDGRSPNGSASRFNALKHGLTAKTAILPWEDPAEFEATVDDFKTGLGTRNPLEDRLAQDAALASWQKDRANRCEVARITRDRQTQSEALELREAKEALALGNRLLHDRRSPIQLYPSGQYENRQLRTSWSGQPNDPDDPAQLVLDLCATVAGVRWLLAAWAALRDDVESGLGLTSRAKITAVRLLGKQPLDSLHSRDVALVFLASHAIEPVYSYAFQELRCEIHEDQWKRAKRDLDRWNRRGIAPADATAGRAALLSIVDREMARLRVLEAERERAAGSLDTLQDDIVSVEDSKAGEQVRRLKERCDQTKLRNIEAVRKGHRIEAQGWGRTRKEREARKGGRANDEGGTQARPFDDRLVVDEQGNVRSAEEYVEAGLARYDLELGQGPPRPRRAAMSEVVPPAVPDFARWMAAEEKRKSDEGLTRGEDGGRWTADRDWAEPGFGSGGERIGQPEGVPLILTGHGAETKVQNEIDEAEERSGADVEHAAERHEALSHAGAWEREENEIGEGEQRSGAEVEHAAERQEGLSHAGAWERGNADGGPLSGADVEDAAVRQGAHSHAGAWERGIADGGQRSGADVEDAAERQEAHSHAGAWERCNEGPEVGGAVAGGRGQGSKREKRRLRREMHKKELEKRAARKTKALDAPIEEVIDSVKWLLPNCAKVLRDHYSRSP